MKVLRWSLLLGVVAVMAVSAPGASAKVRSHATFATAVFPPALVVTPTHSARAVITLPPASYTSADLNFRFGVPWAGVLGLYRGYGISWSLPGQVTLGGVLNNPDPQFSSDPYFRTVSATPALVALLSSGRVALQFSWFPWEPGFAPPNAVVLVKLTVVGHTS